MFAGCLGSRFSSFGQLWVIFPSVFSTHRRKIASIESGATFGAPLDVSKLFDSSRSTGQHSTEKSGLKHFKANIDYPEHTY